MPHDAFERRRNHPDARGQFLRFLVQNRGHGFRASGTFECALPANHFVQNTSVAENIGKLIRWLAPDLLRRHVADGAQHHAGISLSGGHAVHSFGLCVRTAQLRQSEIQDFQAPVFGDEYVFRFQVAMRNALIVRGGQPVGQLHRQLHCFASSHALRRNTLPQRFAFDQFRNDVMNFIGNADVEDGNDVRMVERSNRARFLFETAQPIGIGGKRFLQNFQRHVAQQPRIVCAINFTHSAGADQRNDSVWTKLCVYGKGH